MIIPTAAAQKQPRILPEAARRPKDLVGALAALLSALGVAGLIRLMHSVLPQPERAVALTGVLFAGILFALMSVYFWRARGNAQPADAGLLFLAGCSVMLLGVYFYWVSWYVAFPADVLIWSEGDFVNDIIKFTVGYPLYTAQVNNDSFTYVPGPQLVTYFLAWIAGQAGSIPFYRLMQVGYTAMAALVALLCCRRIAGRAPSPAWTVLQYSVLLLIATNSITNRFTHNLHGDALAQLATLTAYWLLLVYNDTRDPRVLGAMALVAPVGFLAKQSLLIWAGLYTAFLVIWARNWRRIVLFGAATSGLTAIVVGTCYAIWGGPFFYWTFHVLGSHAVLPLRSFQHALDSWTYLAAGLLGGAAVLYGRKSSLQGAWLVWLGLIAVETYTSGIAWMLNHMGPGCLIAGVWALSGFRAAWESAAESWQAGASRDWIAAGASTLSVVLVFSGMGLVRIPVQPVSNDAYRYVRDIEAQFANQPAERTLLDVGSWVYWRDRAVMGDRAPGIGERGFSGTADFSGVLSRISQKRYAKLLMRDFDKPDFWYDHSAWPASSGIRQAMEANYRKTGSIRAAEPPVSFRDRAEDPYLFSEITILEPKTVEQ